jgi:hypothetical protein
VCPGPGEGDLSVSVRGDNFAAGDTNGDGVDDGLGAFEFSFSPDSMALSVTGMRNVVFNTGGAGSTRGPAYCVPPPPPGVGLACFTAGAMPPGPTGDIVLASFALLPDPGLAGVLRAVPNNGVVTTLVPRRCDLTGTFGGDPSSPVACGSLRVSVRILESDVNLDCHVNSSDLQHVAAHVLSRYGDARYDPRYDLNPGAPDGAINAQDLARVAARFGSTCQLPIPAQPPA